MGRAEQRRAEREAQKGKKTYTLTQEQIDKIKDDAVKEASDVAFLLMLAIPVMVLHDKWWEKTAKKRCPVFVDQCLDLFDSFLTVCPPPTPASLQSSCMNDIMRLAAQRIRGLSSYRRSLSKKTERSSRNMF